MPTINFISGNTKYIPIEDFLTITNRMISGGLKFTKLKDGDWIPLNSNTMEFISCQDIPKREKIKYADPEEEAKVIVSQEIVEKVEVEKKAIEDRRKEELAELIAKSNCTHDGDKISIFKSDSKKGIRYFKVCKFCGYRDRFIKESELTTEQKDNALFYQEK